MNDLIAKLEAATEGSRELYIAIYTEGLGKRATNHDSLTDDQRARHFETFAPDFTTSLDAAMTLVPEGCDVTLEWWTDINGKLKARADVRSADGDRVYHGRTMPSAALALCTAALEAREAGEINAALKARSQP